MLGCQAVPPVGDGAANHQGGRGRLRPDGEGPFLYSFSLGVPDKGERGKQEEAWLPDQGKISRVKAGFRGNFQKPSLIGEPARREEEETCFFIRPKSRWQPTRSLSWLQLLHSSATVGANAGPGGQWTLFIVPSPGALAGKQAEAGNQGGFCTVASAFLGTGQSPRDLKLVSSAEGPQGQGSVSGTYLTWTRGLAVGVPLGRPMPWPSGSV